MEKNAGGALTILLLPIVAILLVIGGVGLLVVFTFGVLLDILGEGGLAILAVLLGLGLVARVGIWLWERVGVAHATIQSAHLKAQFIAPDEQGLLPVHGALLQLPQFGAATLIIHAARRGGVKAAERLLPPPVETEITVAAPFAPQTFWQLYQGRQLPSQGFLMGYSLEDRQPITAGWEDLYSTLVGGKSRMGKSTLIRSILAQSALQGGRFVVIDPHFGVGEDSLGLSLQPLRHLMLCDVAKSEKEIIDALAYVDTVGRQRVSGADRERWPLVLVADETTGLFQRSQVAGELTRVLGHIAQETAKAKVYAMCIGQNFNSKIMDTTVRNSFVSMVTMRARRDVARDQSGNNEFGKLAETLTVGQCVWMSPGGEMHRLAVPNCTADDLRHVAQQIPAQNVRIAANRALSAPVPAVEATSSATSAAPSLAPSPTLETTGSRSASALVAEVADEAKAKRIIEAFIAGDSITKIVKEEYGANGGDKYTKASNEVNEILRSYMLKLEGAK